jgi:hypothetical protein
MGTTMLFQVLGSMFNIAQLPKYMELGQCCLSGPVAGEAVGITISHIITCPTICVVGTSTASVTNRRNLPSINPVHQ